jgi:cytidine deaminase
MTNEHRDLIVAAQEIRRRSYSPYSRFRVGAAILGDDERVYVGTNVENASFGLSLCAERNAVAAAVAAGCRTFRAVAIVADPIEPTPPCGACRQVLREFGFDTVVLLAGSDGPAGEVITTTVGELLPLAFTEVPETDSGPDGKERP